jgi:hypothetical protein
MFAPSASGNPTTDSGNAVVRGDILSAVPLRLECSHTARRFVPSGIELVLELSCRGFDTLELIQQFGFDGASAVLGGR